MGGFSAPAYGALYYRDTQTADAFSAILSTLEAGYSAAIVAQADSLGDETNEYLYLTAAQIGTDLAAQGVDIRVQEKYWIDANQAYGPWTVIRAGAAGERYIQFNGGAAPNRTRYVAYGEIGDYTNYLDLRVRAETWTGLAATQLLMARWASSTTAGFRFGINTTGTLVFNWSNTGNTGTSSVTVNSSVATGFVNGTAGWVRVVFDGRTTRTVTFYTSTDGVTWTQLGTVSTGGGADTIFAPTQDYTLGGRGTNTETYTGKIYAAEIRLAPTGPILNPQPIESWRKYNSDDITSTVIGGSPTLYVINGAKAGADVAYHTNATRHPLMVEPYERALSIMSSSHNDTSSGGKVWTAALDGWLTLNKARLPIAQFGFLTENPRGSTIPWVDDHAKRCMSSLFWGQRNNVIALDGHRAFTKALAGGASFASLVSSVDNIHPTIPTGRDLLATVTTKPFTARKR